MNISPKLLKAAVYGSNDGIITTFAVVAGVRGAGLPAKIIIILGLANMVADAVSMGVGDYLGEKSEQRLRKITKVPYRIKGLWKSGLVTFCAFILAGSLPLIPYLLQSIGLIHITNHFLLSTLSTAIALFFVGSLRTIVTKGVWWKNGVEMLTVGALAAGVAYGIGYLLEGLV